jgi:nifR3 family TIM-barrel protein
MVDRVKATLRHTPLTAKLRLGWDESCIVAPYLAARLEEAGVSLVTIHGRTTAMKFSGEARLEGIAEVVAAVKRIPVIGNGDVRTPQDARRMIDSTGCAGVMIGRGALSAPWLLRDTWSYLTTGTIPPPPSIEQKCQLMRDHFYNICRFRREVSAVNEFRKRVSWYAKQMHPCQVLKQEMRTIESSADFEQVLARFLDWRLRHDEDLRQGRVRAEEPQSDLVEAA